MIHGSPSEAVASLGGENVAFREEAGGRLGAKVLAVISVVQSPHGFKQRYVAADSLDTQES